MRVPAATEGIVLLSLWRRLQLRHDINNRAPYSFTKPSRGNKTIPRVVYPSHAVHITQCTSRKLPSSHSRKRSRGVEEIDNRDPVEPAIWIMRTLGGCAVSPTQRLSDILRDMSKGAQLPAAATLIGALQSKGQSPSVTLIA
jgi:hypothetical protein